jgi:NADH-quinone oxidoreductase subunit I
MANNEKTYFQEIADGVKTLAVGMKTTLKEYFKAKSTEQYPENRKTTLHVSKRFRGRLVFKRDEEGAHKCTACTMCEKACPNDTIRIVAQHGDQRGDRPQEEAARRLSVRPLGDCMFCQLCVNACNFDDAIEFTNDFEHAVFDRSKLVMHLDKEVYDGGSLPNLIDGGATAHHR